MVHKLTFPSNSHSNFEVVVHPPSDEAVIVSKILDLYQNYVIKLVDNYYASSYFDQELDKHKLDEGKKKDVITASRNIHKKLLNQYIDKVGYPFFNPGLSLGYGRRSISENEYHALIQELAVEEVALELTRIIRIIMDQMMPFGHWEQGFVTAYQHAFGLKVNSVQTDKNNRTSYYLDSE